MFYTFKKCRSLGLLHPCAHMFFANPHSHLPTRTYLINILYIILLYYLLLLFHYSYQLCNMGEKTERPKDQKTERPKDRKTGNKWKLETTGTNNLLTCQLDYSSTKKTLKIDSLILEFLLSLQTIIWKEITIPGERLWQMQKDRNKADEYRAKAYQGDTKAMNNLGVCYERGTGVKENLTMAFEWYMRAAEQDDIYGCFNVGECYYHGKGVEQSAEQAFLWYLKAAEKGDTQSQVNIANAYYLGQGVEEDHHKAFLWYREAAFQGHLLSQKNVGAAYWNGDGVDKDLEECVFWYELAARMVFGKL